MDAKFNPHEVLADKKNLICTCPDVECEWHGNCKDCVALHRYMNTVPNCLEVNIFQCKNIFTPM